MLKSSWVVIRFRQMRELYTWTLICWILQPSRLMNNGFANRNVPFSCSWREFSITMWSRNIRISRTSSYQTVSPFSTFSILNGCQRTLTKIFRSWSRKSNIIEVALIWSTVIHCRFSKTIWVHSRLVHAIFLFLDEN